MSLPNSPLDVTQECLQHLLLLHLLRRPCPGLAQEALFRRLPLPVERYARAASQPDHRSLLPKIEYVCPIMTAMRAFLACEVQSWGMS